MKLIRWTRTIEFIGPEDWINQVKDSSWLAGHRVMYRLGEGKKVKLLSERRTEVINEDPEGS